MTILSRPRITSLFFSHHTPKTIPPDPLLFWFVCTALLGRVSSLEIPIQKRRQSTTNDQGGRTTVTPTPSESGISFPFCLDLHTSYLSHPSTPSRNECERAQGRKGDGHRQFYLRFKLFLIRKREEKTKIEFAPT